MSTTTQILFNSPALHSLKRDQLVKLCKIHSLKANGKNVELISRLKFHAQTLPKDSPLSIAARSEDGDEELVQDDNVSIDSYAARPSQQWEVVMDSIAEDEEGSSKGTISSLRTLGDSGNAGEFGTGSSKASTVGSSIKALATSLGLKRNISKASVPPPSNIDELTQFSTPYSALPPAASLPQTDHFTFTPSRLSTGTLAEVIPGHALRPGVPAPENARLSLGSGVPATPHRKQPTTTIRLIANPLSNVGNDSYGAGENGTPQLKPFETTFDLVLGSPSSNIGTLGFGLPDLACWPPRDEDEEPHSRLYPKLTMDDLPPVTSPTPVGSSGSRIHNTRATRDVDGDVMMDEDPDPSPDSPSPDSNQLKPPSEPFIFGSPHPRYSVSNDQFRSAATSVLEEMNKRLQEEGIDGVSTDLIGKLKPGAHTVADLQASMRDMKSIPNPKQVHIKDMFNKAHDQEFKKMEGIDEFLKRRSPTKKEDQLWKKRKSSVLGTGAGRDAHGRRIPGAHVGRVSNTRVISGGRRSRVIPGSFDIDSDDEDAPEGEREDKRVDTEEAAMCEDQGEKLRKEEEELERMQKEREREAIRKKLEMNKAKRRSSAAHGGLSGRKSGRVSVGRGGLLVVKPQPKPSRFGFLTSAKSIVKNVWNRGKTTAAPPPPSSLPKPAVAVPKGKEKEKTELLAKKPSVVPVRPSFTHASSSNSTQPTSLRVRNGKEQDSGKGTASSKMSRSPFPSFGATSSARGSVTSTNARSSRTGSLVSHSRNGSLTAPSAKVGTLNGTDTGRTSGAGVSSLGARSATSRISNMPGSLGSMGLKKVPNSRTDSTSSKRMSSISSRLMAPTASSLAKMQRPSVMGMKDVAEMHAVKATTSSSKQSETLGAITNSPAVKSVKAFPRTPGKIFSSPLEFRSGIPTPVKKGPTSPSVDESSVEVPQNSQLSANTSGIIRQKTLSGRKPRISRSKVIARLASQRAAGTSSTGTAVLTPRVVSTGKIRSSIGAKAQRASFAGGAASSAKRRSGGSDVLMSAKKRARQSEYARRRSRAGKPDIDADD